MARIVIYDPNDVIVPNRVTDHIPSANTPDYDSEPNKLVNPDVSSLSSVPLKHWKVSGSDVLEMSQSEKDAIQADVDASMDAEMRTTAKGQYDGLSSDSLILKALVKVIIDEINILRALHVLPSRTLSQAKNAIKTAIDNNSVDNE